MLKIRKVIIAILAAAVLMTGCGGGFDFSETELSSAMGVKKTVFDGLDIKPDDNGDTGVELMEQAKALGGADMYTYWLPDGSGDSYDIVQIFFYGGKVSSVTLMAFGKESSDRTLLGIKIGDSRASASSKAEAYFGESGKALSDDKEAWGLTDMERDYINYGGASNKKGSLTLIVDCETDKVISVEYSEY